MTDTASSPDPAAPSAPADTASRVDWLTTPAPELDDTQRWLAWAGWMLPLPRDWRLIGFGGDPRKGVLRVADPHVERLQVIWTTPKRKPRDLVTAMRNLLKRSAAEAAKRKSWWMRASPSGDMLERIVEPAPAGGPLIEPQAVGHPGDPVYRVIGFSEPSGRVVQAILRPSDKPEEDALAQRAIHRGWIDQPPDAPHRWSVYQFSFAAPAGYRFHGARLNLGDLRITLQHPRMIVSSFEPRQIYPARLAMKRSSLIGWCRTLALENTDSHKPRMIREQGKKTPRIEPFDSPRGPGVRCDGIIRNSTRISSGFRAPKLQRLWVIHDEEADRLLSLRLIDKADDAERFDPWVRSLHWAGPVRPSD